jgi:gluconokinase
LVLIVMGVEGSGKTTVGVLLAQKLGWEFADADAFHSPENIRKISNGIPLTDADRAPWLAGLHQAIQEWVAQGKNAVLAGSALKRSYRAELVSGTPPETVRFVYLKGSHDLILARLRSRHGHFARESILVSQFADLEEPENAITVEVDRTPEAIVSEIICRLGALQAAYPDAAPK